MLAKVPKSINWHICLLLAVILVLGFFPSFVGAPTTEGWYLVYADMIFAGKVPYVDFELVLPPFYPYFIAGFTYVFGGSLMSFRILGMIMLAVFGIVTYYLFKCLFSESISAVASIITVCVFISGNSAIFYDYHIFYIVFSEISMIFLVRYFISQSRDGPALYSKEMLLLAGCFAALTFFTRQATGLFLIVFEMLALLLSYYIKSMKSPLKSMLYMAIGICAVAVIVVIGLAVQGAFSDFIQSVFFSGTKGSMLDMCTHWLKVMFEETLGLFVVILLAIAVVFSFDLKVWELRSKGPSFKTMLLLGAFLVGAICCLFLSGRTSSWSKQFYDSISLCSFVSMAILTVLLVKIGRSIVRKEELPFDVLILTLLCGFSFVVDFGSGVSNVVDRMPCSFTIALVVALLFTFRPKISMSKACLEKVLCAALVVSIVLPCAAIKVESSYSWWNAVEPSYAAMTETIDDGYFDGIRVSSSEKELYESFLTACDIYLGESDELYCYANIPIFYHLAGKIPTVQAPVPWFDVCSDKVALEDLAYLKENNPKMIVFSDHTESALDVHESLFRGGGICGQRYIYDWLMELTDDAGDTSLYSLYGSYNVNGWMYYILVRN